MNLEDAMVTMQGYMAPRSDAINIFAQTGKVTEGLLDAIYAEIAEQLFEARMCRTAVLESEAMQGYATEHCNNAQELALVVEFIESM